MSSWNGIQVHEVRDSEGRAPTTPLKTCLDCPTVFKSQGKKVRCSPCAWEHQRKYKNARPRIRNRKKVAP